MKKIIAIKKEKIINFVNDAIKQGVHLKRIDIEKLFHIDLRCYFQNMDDLYNTIGIDYGLIKEEIIKNRVNLAMQRRRRFKSKEVGRAEICKFLRKNTAKGIFPTCRDIERGLRINIPTYFKNIKEIYGEIGITYSKTLKKHGKTKEEVRKDILNFITELIYKSVYLSGEQIRKKFHVDLTDYFSGGIKEIYTCLGKDYHKVRKIINQRNNLRFGDVQAGREKIAEFIQKSIEQGIYPGYNEINTALAINIPSYFSGIKEAYNYAKISYTKNPNQLISLEKEKKLREISIFLLDKLGFTIIKERSTINEDILIKDQSGNIIPVELKAYHRNNSIPNKLSYLNKKYENEIEQLSKYIKNNNSPYGILITSTNKIRIKIPEDIKLFKADDIFSLLQQSNQLALTDELNWIRNTYTSKKKELMIDLKRKQIIDFVKENLRRGNNITIGDIQNKFNIDYRTYFNGGAKEIYEFCDAPTKNY